MSQKNNGIALISVLWLSLLISLLLAGAIATTRSEVRAVAAGQSYFYAEQAIENSLSQLQLKIANREIKALGEFRRYQNRDKGFTVSIVAMRDEGLKIDLNTVTEQALGAALLDFGLSDEQARRYRDTVLDWRDKDDERREFGAESAEYLRVKKNKPGNRHFFSETEVKNRLNIDWPFKNQVEDLFSVMGRSSAPSTESLHAVLLGRDGEDVTTLGVTEYSENKLFGRKLTVNIRAEKGDTILTTQRTLLVTGRSQAPLLTLKN